MTDAAVAQKAVEFYQRTRGIDAREIKHSPLHYNMADFVTGLMQLARAKGLDWKAIVRDAKEGVEA